jgi:hypothetical protein
LSSGLRPVATGIGQGAPHPQILALRNMKPTICIRYLAGGGYDQGAVVHACLGSARRTGRLRSRAGKICLNGPAPIRPRLTRARAYSAKDTGSTNTLRNRDAFWPH